MAARKLIKALKNEISIPVHLHTHDTSGNGVAAILMATAVVLRAVCDAGSHVFSFGSSV